MELSLEDLVPWGRQLNEYVRIFQLTPSTCIEGSSVVPTDPPASMRR